MCVCVSKKTANHFTSVYTQWPCPRSSHSPPPRSPSTVLLSSLTLSLLLSPVSVIPSSKILPQRCQVGSENPNPLHFNAVSYRLTYRPFAGARSGAAPSTRGHVCRLRAATPSLLTSVRSARIGGIPLDLKAFTSHHEARNSSVTLLVCFKPQWEPCAGVLWDWSPPRKKLFPISVKQHAAACASSARCPARCLCFHHLCEERLLWLCYVTTPSVTFNERNGSKPVLLLNTKGDVQQHLHAPLCQMKSNDNSWFQKARRNM